MVLNEAGDACVCDADNKFSDIGSDGTVQCGCDASANLVLNADSSACVCNAEGFFVLGSAGDCECDAAANFVLEGSTCICNADANYVLNVNTTPASCVLCDVNAGGLTNSMKWDGAQCLCND